MNNNTILLPGERAVAVGERVRVIDNGRGLSWGTDAYLLAAFVRRREHAVSRETPAKGQECPRKISRACELGSGCGVVSFLVAAHGKADTVTALEINEDAYDRTCRGILYNGLSDRVTAVRRDVREADFRAPELGGKFDTVFSNPPYIAHPGLSGADSVADDARHENHGGIADFCAAAARLLLPRGSFFCVFRPERAADLFCALREARLEPKRLVTVYPDRSSKPSLLLCEAVLGAAAGLNVSRPLFFYADTADVQPRAMSPEMQKIYAECSFDCVFAP